MSLSQWHGPKQQSFIRMILRNLSFSNQFSYRVGFLKRGKESLVQARLRGTHCRIRLRYTLMTRVLQDREDTPVLFVTGCYF